MDLKTARKLRDFIRSHGVKATVPLGYHHGDRYFVKTKDDVFNSIDEYNAKKERAEGNTKGKHQCQQKK